MKTSSAYKELSYLDFLGLDYNPFPVAPDDENFYISEHIDQILAEIVHGIISRKGFMVLTGDVGLGKTTISRRILSVLEEKGIETSLCFHTSYQDVELLREINRDFGVKTASLLFSEQMKLLNDFLLDKNREGKNCAIIIDDAQNLNNKSLELIRMISNLEANQQKLVQILLVGQGELMDKLNSRELRQLKSRIIIKKEVRPLKLKELENYLLFKLNVSGSGGLTNIRKSALSKIQKYTSGNFRQINILMDRCLYVAFLNNTTEISGKIIKEAYIDLNPGGFRLKKRITVLSLVIFLPLFLFAGFIYFTQDKTSPLFGVNTIRKMITPAKGLKMLPAVANAGEVPVHPQMMEIDKKTVSLPVPVADFLKAYKLSMHENLFFEALETGRFQEVAVTILSKSGYQLIRLEHIPDHVKRKYGVLSYPNAVNGKKGYFLFWKPAFTLKKFYYSYRGKEIQKLQKELVKINLYNYHLDGIVGKKLMSAVIAFQKQIAIPVTGYPDEKTIFLLCHKEGINQV
ncbi:MAG: AAA family ATPase [Desulfobacula sp.]|uniref:ExeA family protein n=1 Tax=Desulfobacula sp. TaxID=2593537 RepID=UPI0025C2C305|nr:ExeA family protein [Desulfobacula sp.]MCD4722038.1 AAA family ATPase [Desulfobacula sp.]